MINIITDTGIEEEKLSLLGLDLSVVTNKEADKEMLINRATGVPEVIRLIKEDNEKVGGFSINIGKDKLYGFGILTDDEEELLLSCFYCSNRTYYLVGVKDSYFTFYVNLVSTNITEAIFNIFVSNMSRGEANYTKTNTLIPNFFSKVFAKIYEDEEYVLNEFNIVSYGGDFLVPAALYYCRTNPERNILSLGGVCTHFDFEVFPRKDISNAFRVHQQKLEADKPSLKETSFGKGVVTKDGSSLADLLGQLNIRKDKPAILRKH